MPKFPSFYFLSSIFGTLILAACGGATPSPEGFEETALTISEVGGALGREIDPYCADGTLSEKRCAAMQAIFADLFDAVDTAQDAKAAGNFTEAETAIQKAQSALDAIKVLAGDVL